MPSTTTPKASEFVVGVGAGVAVTAAAWAALERRGARGEHLLMRLAGPRSGRQLAIALERQGYVVRCASRPGEFLLFASVRRSALDTLWPLRPGRVKLLGPPLALLALWAGREPAQLPVFWADSLSRVEPEIHIVGCSDDDATRQLEHLANALDVDRDLLTIKPPRGWLGYGHPGPITSVST